MTNSLIGMTDLVDATGSVLFGNSQVLKVTKIGKKAATILQNNGIGKKRGKLFRKMVEE